jgi:hypothetical protein
MVFVGHDKFNQIETYLKKRYWNIYDRKLFAVDETCLGGQHRSGTLRALMAGLQNLSEYPTSKDAVAVLYGDSYLHNLDVRKMLDVFSSRPTPREIPLMAVMEAMPSKKYKPNYSRGWGRKILPLMADGCTRVIDYGVALYNKYTIEDDVEKFLDLGKEVLGIEFDYNDFIEMLIGNSKISAYMMPPNKPFFEVGSFHGIANLTAATIRGKYDRYLCPRLFL